MPDIPAKGSARHIVVPEGQYIDGNLSYHNLADRAVGLPDDVHTALQAVELQAADGVYFFDGLVLFAAYYIADAGGSVLGKFGLHVVYAEIGRRVHEAVCSVR